VFQFSLQLLSEIFLILRRTKHGNIINLLKPNDIYMSYRSANLQTLLLNIYSTNIHTEYFKHAA